MIGRLRSVLLLFCVALTSVVAQPTISYITPDVCAPGMGVYVEFVAPVSATGGYGADQMHLNNASSKVRIECVRPDDTNRLVISPLVVSWNGRLVSATLFVPPTVSPNSSDWSQLKPEFRIPIRLVVNGVASNTDTVYIVRPWPMSGIAGLSERVLGEGQLGRRSRRGAMIVDSLVMGAGTYRVSLLDCDPNTVGNQAFLPITIISRGRISCVDPADTARTKLNGSALGLTGGPGGGGGAGAFSNFNLSGSKGTNGGDGFTGGGPGGSNFDRTRMKPGIGSGENLDAAAATTRGSRSLNGIDGGEVTTSFENAGGGTGHPFGQSGIGCSDRLTCNTSGANGGGSGGQEAKRGGGGGFATKGESEVGFTNGGFAHGNSCLVPLSGGSGGAGGNPDLGRAIAAGGGGGGGAVSVHGSEVSNITVVSQGGVPQRQALQGGCGSGGGIIMGSRTQVAAAASPLADVTGGTDPTTGDRHLDGGIGRVRFDGPNTVAGSSYSGTTILSRDQYTRTSRIEGSRGASGIYAWIRAEHGQWQQVLSPANTWPATPRAWNLDLTWPGIDSVFYVVTAQELVNPKSIPYGYEPNVVMSQSGSHVVRVVNTAPISIDSVDFGALTCRGSAVLDTVWVRNLTISPMKINALTMVPPTEWTILAPISKSPIPAGDSAFTVVRFSNSGSLPAGKQNAQLRVTFNDTLTAQSAMKAEVGSITIDYIWRGLLADTIDIGRVCIGKPVTEPITIRKIGKGLITMTSFATVDGAVISVKANTPISLNDSVSFGYVLVNFTAKQLGTYIVPIIVKFAECSISDTIWVRHVGVESSMTFTGNGQFGDVRVGDRKESIYELRNTGTSEINIVKLPVLQAPFRIVSSIPAPPFDLKPGEAMTMTVAFEPVAVGSFTTIMRLVGDSTVRSCVDSLNVPLAGRGVASTVVLSPTSLSFPVVAACDSASECVTITNKGALPLTLIAPPVVNGIHANSFRWKSGPATDSLLKPNESITYCVTMFGVYGPDGVKSAVLSIRTDDPVLKTINIGLNGQRTTVNLDGPRVVDIGVAGIGKQATITQKYTNTSALPVTVRSVLSSNPGRTSATSVPITIAAGGTQNFVFQYNCSAEESIVDTIRFVIDEPCIDTIVIIARARGGSGSVSASQKINYGIVPECGNRRDSIVIFNNGSLPIDLVQFMGISGYDAASFTCSNPTNVQNQQLAPGDQRTLYILFNPSASTDGLKIAYATVQARVNDTLVSIVTELRGERRTSLPINPQYLVFGAVSISASSTQSVTLFNTGVDNLTVRSIRMKNGAGNVFSVTSVPAAPMVIAPGASVDVSVLFQPKEQLYYLDSIVIELEKPCSEERILAVSGTGQVVIDVVLKAPRAELDPVSRDLRLPIIAAISGEARRVDSVSVDITLRMASSLFHVQGVAGGTLRRNEVVGGFTELDIEIRQAILDGDSTILCELLGDATLGPIDSTEVVFDTASIQITSVTPRLYTRDGYLVTTVCEAGGKRLVNLAGRLAVSITPNPVRDDNMMVNIDVYERGLHTIRVVDVAGQTVWNTSWHHLPGQPGREHKVDVSGLGAGLYQLILETPTRRRVEPLSIVR